MQYFGLSISVSDTGFLTKYFLTFELLFISLVKLSIEHKWSVLHIFPMNLPLPFLTAFVLPFLTAFIKN